MVRNNILKKNILIGTNHKTGTEMKRSIEELDLNHYNNRFQHNAYSGVNFEQVSNQLKQSKVGLCLR